MTFPHHKAWVPTYGSAQSTAGAATSPSAWPPGQADQRYRLVENANPGGTAIPSVETVTFLPSYSTGCVLMCCLCHAAVQWLTLSKCFCQQYCKISSSKKKSPRNQNPILSQITAPLNHLSYPRQWASLQRDRS